MKKILFVSAILAATAVQAQKAPAKKTASPAVLKSANDSLSYAIGVNVANFYKQQGMKSINSALVARAINDMVNKKTPLINENQCNVVLMDFVNKAQEEQNRAQAKGAQAMIAAGERFLAENKKKPGVTTTASGLQYEVITEATGPKPKATDQVTVHYKGTLLDGYKFDASYDRGQPATFGLNQVIPGWTEGVQLMSKGAKYKFYIPYQLGYGIQGNPGGKIPGGSVLVFEVELLDIK